MLGRRPAAMKILSGKRDLQPMIDYREFTVAIAREAGTVLKEMLNKKHTVIT